MLHTKGATILDNETNGLHLLFKEAFVVILVTPWCIFPSDTESYVPCKWSIRQTVVIEVILFLKIFKDSMLQSFVQKRGATYVAFVHSQDPKIIPEPTSRNIGLNRLSVVVMVVVVVDQEDTLRLIKMNFV